MPLAGVVMGSQSDEALARETLAILDQLGIEYEVSIVSAHRKPEQARQYAQGARERGIEVIIALAGASAHLPGVLASWTTLPVIGVPLPTSNLQGLDSLLSIAQMPAGVPVACMAVGKAGARNAALFAAQILGLKHDKIKQAYQRYRQELSQG